MKILVKKGDVLLYFNQETILIVIVDEISLNNVAFVLTENTHYFYGQIVNIKNVTSKYFMVLDHFDEHHLIGKWEKYKLK